MVMNLARILGFSLKGSNASAHEVHLNTIAYDDEGKARHVIFKKNKFSGKKGQESSRLEACFTAAANAYSSPDRALGQDIVINSHNQIVGVSSEHAAHALLRLRQKNKNTVFLQAPHPLPEGTISSEQFETWIKGHTRIDESPKNTVTNLGGSKWAAMAIRRVFQEHEDTQREMEENYNQRLDDYWEERLRLGEFQNIDPKDLQIARLYCQEQLSRGITEFDVNQIPSRLKPTLEPLSDLLRYVFAVENLRKKWGSYQAKAENLEQEAAIARYDVGKGIQFLNKMPQNFFARLMKQKNRGNVDIDMDSLADVFTTAYGLEEDDLHKGNIGYYVTQEQGRPRFHFFKIDHDLMFSDKIMAARSARAANLRYSSDKFRITARDLIGFPDLQDSGNHYWPTKRAIFTSGSKAYHNDEDRAAYKELKDDLEFQKAKWKRFLKQAVLPPGYLSRCLRQPLLTANTDPEMESTLTIVQRANSSKIAELRTRLLSIPQFKEYLEEHFVEASQSIIDEIEEYCIKMMCTERERQQYKRETLNMLHSINEACQQYTPETALHAAIQTQSYRCFESAKYFKNILNNTDQEGKTPLDFAIARFHECEERLRTHPKNPKAVELKQMQVYYADVILDLDQHQGKHHFSEVEYSRVLATVKTTSSASILIPRINTLEDFKYYLGVMRNSPLQTLKQDKVYAVKLLEKADLSEEELLQLKDELNMKEPPGHLKFIKELRSEIWIIKKIRGVYGETGTVSQMKTCIDQKLQQLREQPQESGSLLSFYNSL